jgi:exodeoxyribonuclease VII large subunit
VTSSPEEPWPVRKVSHNIGQWIGRLGWLWIDGQIAQIGRRPGVSTVFITLRDPSADLSLTVTAPRDVVDPDLSDGARVIVHAKPEWYATRGTLSLRADEIRQMGEGELKARIERLRKLLEAEGLFDPRRKRRPPFLPQRIGLITGRAGAAERDVLTNARRRWPAIDFRVVNVAVQGVNAVPEILEALRSLDRDDSVDVIILARGGGSFEDLLPFSDEALCRAVFACRTPVISAIGHEPDAPLVDYVADVRASTPTDAGKRVVPDLAEEQRLIQVARGRLDRAVRNRLDREQHRLDAIRSRPSMARPTVLLDRLGEDIAAGTARMRRVLDHRLTRADGELGHTIARLRALSPSATLARGYAIVQKPGGDVVRSTTEVAGGEALRVRLGDGTLDVTVSG